MARESWQVLAAKFREREHGPSYHPLACHMADVAAVALALWDRCLPVTARSTLARSLGLTETEAARWVAFIAGLHDLGKATRTFQAKDKGHDERLRGSGLRAGRPAEDPGHARATNAFLPELLRGIGVERRLAWRLAEVLGGHHGVFSNDPAKPTPADVFEDEAGCGDWAGARRDLFEAFMEVADLPHDEVGNLVVPTGKPGGAALMLLAGFVSVADWIGSIDQPGYFVYEPTGAEALGEYFRRTCDRAHSVLSMLHWDAFPPPQDEEPGFLELFGFDPNPLQAAVQELRPSLAPPGLAIIEAPMGEGKTEAALIIADRWGAAGVRGLYLALPTQATANTMHERLLRYLTRRYASHLAANGELNAVLTHGAAALRDDLNVLPSGIAGEADANEGTVGAAEWFLGRKRPLLAPFGVGTIDQALMAVLQVKHVFVRLFGLAGKTVIIDEVHAYDTYMTGLLERLLQWLAALGSPVVLLSATLPAERRRQLAAAYLGGLGAPSPSAVEEAAYPRVTWTEAGAIHSRSFAVSDRGRRTLELDRDQAGEDPAELAEWVAHVLEPTGCAAIICNTVDRAQVAYRAFREQFAEGEVLLFHSRFTHEDRERIEAECVRHFGPGERLPGPRIVVATQVLEQSLDLDFDLMVTDFAPVDLLLQRSGRLMRHPRATRGGPGRPILFIRRLAITERGPSLESVGGGPVYDEHILLRTWDALAGVDSITVPDGIPPLVDRVYSGEIGEPGDVALSERWHRTWEALQTAVGRERQEANSRRLNIPSSSSPSALLPNPRAEDEPDIHPALQAVTRLADPSVPLVILPPDEELPPGKPTTEIARRMLRRAVSVTRRDLVKALAAFQPPKGWDESPWLRRHRLVRVAPGEESLEVPGFAIRYDGELGLEVERR